MSFPFYNPFPQVPTTGGGDAPLGYLWLLEILQKTEGELPADAATRVLDSSLRHYLADYPCVAQATDPSDLEWLEEAVGYRAAARAIYGPLASDMLVTKTEIGGLAEWYKVTDAESLSGRWLAYADAAFSRISCVAEDLPDDTTANMAIARVRFANPTRAGGGRNPDTLRGGIFAPREEAGGW